MAAPYIIIQLAEEKNYQTHEHRGRGKPDPIFGVEGFNMQISNEEWVS